MSNQRETVGKIATDLISKSPESRDPIELERSMQEDYLKELIVCIKDGIKIYDDNFYVVVLTKRERLMPNVFRNYFFHRKSCPTPEYDQSLYFYDRNKEEAAYMWTVPSRDTCYHLRENALEVIPEERHLLDFVLQFFDGSLFELSKKLNSEQKDSPLLIEG